MTQVAPGAAAAGVHGFTAALTSFVGRAAEVTELAAMVDEYRLVTVTGPGGVGKTRAAEQVARRSAGRFADGVWLAELASVSDPALVPTAVCSALGVHQAPGVPVLDSLVKVLTRQQLLLVLDNCEHVLAAAAELCERLLPAADDLRILATSREPLGVAGEARYRLPPLGLPVSGHPAGIGESDAVALFADRARRVDVRFTVDGESGPVVARLVERLDGIPLAIELAAARSRRWARRACLTGSATGCGCWAAGTGRPPSGTGRWPRRRTGATACSPSRSSGCSALSRPFRARSRWKRPRPWPARTPGPPFCAWSTARC